MKITRIILALSWITLLIFLSRVITPSLEQKRTQSSNLHTISGASSLVTPSNSLLFIHRVSRIFPQVLKHMVTSHYYLLYGYFFLMTGFDTLPLWRYFV